MFIRELQLVKDDVVVPHARLNGRLEGARLLHDLLEHEVVVAALLRRFDVPDHAGNLLLDRLPGTVIDREMVGRQLRKFAVVDVNHVFRMRNERRNVGGKEVLARADAEDHRSAVFGDEQAIRLVCTQNAEHIAALQPGGGAHHGLLQIAVIVHVDQMHHNFRIRLAVEHIALGQQHFAQLQIVFDDAVMYDGKLAVIADMRMGVHIRRRAVRGPSGMTDADAAAQVCAVMRLFAEVADHTARFDHMDGPILLHRDAGGVIAAIFERFQPFQQNRRSFLPADIANDSTHIFSPYSYDNRESARPCRACRPVAKP